MCPFDQLHSILKDYIMLLHNRQRKWEDRKRSGGYDQKGENGYKKKGGKILVPILSPKKGPNIEHKKVCEACWECRASVLSVGIKQRSRNICKILSHSALITPQVINMNREPLSFFPPLKLSLQSIK